MPEVILSNHWLLIAWNFCAVVGIATILVSTALMAFMVVIGIINPAEEKDEFFFDPRKR